MTEWPPKDAAALKIWLLDEMPILRERLEVLEARIEAGEATLHQPVNAHLSQINVARTTTSDPTYQVVLLWVDQLPALRTEASAIASMLDEYERAKRALTDRQRQIIEERYDHYQPVQRVCEAMSLTRSPYYEEHSEALRRMLAVVEWMHDEGGPAA